MAGVEGQGEGDEGCQASWVEAEERAQVVQELEDLGGVVGVGWVEGWAQERGDYEAVDRRLGC